MMRFMLTVFSVCSALAQSAGNMEGELIGDITFYRKFENLGSLRCSKVYGRGTQPDKLVSSSEENFQKVRRTLSTDEEETFLDQLRVSEDHDVGIFTPDELRRIIVSIGQHLDFASRQTYLSLSDDWDTVDYNTATSIISDWPPDIFLLMKDSVMCKWMSSMDEKILAKLCLRLAEMSVAVDTVLEYLDRCAYCVGISVRNKGSNDYIGMVRGYKAVAFMEKLKQIYPSPSDWDVNFLMLVPYALTEEDIDKVSDDQFCSQGQMDLLTEERFYEHIRRGVKIKIANRIRKCINKRLSEWPNENFIFYVPYVIYLPPETLKDEFSGGVDKVVNNIAVFTNSTDVMRSGFLQTIGWMLTEYWDQAATTLDDRTKTLLMCIAIKFAPDQTFFDGVSQTDFRTCFENRDLCTSLKLTQEELAPAIESYVTSTDFTWDDTILGVLGPIMGDVKLSILMSSGDNSLCQHWISFKDTPLHTSVVMSVWENCKTNYQHLDTWGCEMIQTTGDFLTMLSRTEVSTIPGSSFYACVDYVEEVLARTGICSSNPGFCEEIVKKIIDDAGQAGVSLNDVLHNLGPVLISSIDNFNENDLNLESFSIIPDNRELASTVWNVMKTMYGDVTTAYRSSTLSNMATVVALGTSLNDFLSLPEDGGFLELLSDMARYIPSMSGKKNEVILDKLRGMFSIYDYQPGIVCIDSAIAQQVGMYFSRASVSVFNKLSLSTRKAVLKAIGHNYGSVQQITRHKMRTLTIVMLRTDGIEKSEYYTEEHIDKYGPYIWCGMKKDHAQKLSASALTKYMTEISRCVHFDSETRATIVEVLKIHLESAGSNLFERPDIMQTFGKFLPDVADIFINSNSLLTKTESDQLVSIIRDIFSKISQFLDEISAIDENVIGLEERHQYRENVHTLATRLYALIGSSGTVSCRLLQNFQGQLGFLTQDIVQDMTIADIIDCLPEFQGDTLQEEVIAIIVANLKTSEGLGDPSTWTISDIVRTGILLDGLSSTEIQALTFTNQIIASLNHIVFSKRAEIITAYLEDRSVGDTSALDKDTLALMGTLLCGYTVSHINSMDKDAAYDSAKDLCHVRCLSTEQLQAFGSRISAHVGADWSSVDPLAVASLGVCMGGLPSSDLNTLNLEQISNLQPIAIKSMPAYVFSEVFDVFTLAALSSDQANVVTDQQRGKLTSEELLVLNSRTTLEEEDTSSISISSGGTRTQCGSTPVEIFIVLLVTFRINI